MMNDPLSPTASQVTHIGIATLPPYIEAICLILSPFFPSSPRPRSSKSTSASSSIRTSALSSSISLPLFAHFASLYARQLAIPVGNPSTISSPSSLIFENFTFAVPSIPSTSTSSAPSPYQPWPDSQMLESWIRPASQRSSSPSLSLNAQTRI